MELGYVTVDGDYGVGVLTFPPDKLTTEQWENLADLHDSDRYDYVVSVLRHES